MIWTTWLYVGAILLLSEICFVYCNLNTQSQAQADVTTHPVYGKDVNVTCGTRDIKVRLAKDFMQQTGWMSSLQSICLSDRKCCASIIDGAIAVTISEDFSSCGNEISIREEYGGEFGKERSRYYEFSNSLKYSHGDGVISRDVTLVKFNCRYPMKQLLTARPSENDISSHVIRIKKVGGEMRLYDDASFSKEYNAEASKQLVYIKIKIEDPGFEIGSSENDDKVVSVLRDCKVKDGATDQQVVVNGCPTRSNTEIISNADSLSSALRIDLQDLSPTENENNTVECYVDLCIKDSPTACEPKCIPRVRRSIDQVVEKKMMDSKYELQFDGERFSIAIPTSNYQKSLQGEQSEDKVVSKKEKKPTKYDNAAIVIPVGMAAFSIAFVLVIVVVGILHATSDDSGSSIDSKSAL